MAHEKFSQTNSVELARALNKVAIARHKNKLISSTTNQLIKQLYEITGDSSVKIPHVNSETLNGEVIFDGSLKITASIRDKGYAKVLDIPIQIVKSNPIFPSNNILKHKIDSIVIKNTRSFNAIQRIASELKKVDRNERYLELQAKGSKLRKIAYSYQHGEALVRRSIEGFEYEYDDRIQAILKSKIHIDDKVTEIKERIAELINNLSDDNARIIQITWDDIEFDDSEIVDFVERAEENVENKESSKEQPKQASVEVKAKEIDVPSHGIDNVPKDKIAETMLVSKVNLPDSTEEGDVINFSGRKYKVSKGMDGFGKEQNAQWLLTLEK